MDEQIRLLIAAYRAKRAEIVERMEEMPEEAEQARLASQMTIEMIDELIETGQTMLEGKKDGR